MKKILLALSVIVALGSCQKVLDKLTTFTFTRDAEFTIPANTILGVPISLNTGEVQTSYISEFENSNASIDNIDYIKLIALNLTIVDPANGNFNFLKDVAVEIRADGLPNKVIASKYDNTDDFANSLVLDASGDDLKPYLTKDKFSLKLDVTTDETIAQDYKVKASTTFEAKANTK